MSAVVRSPLLGALGTAMLTLVACGEGPPAVPPHGLAVEPLSCAGSGAAIETCTDVDAGAWTYEVRKRWTEARDGAAPRRGRAVLRLRVTTRDEAGRLESDVDVVVAEAEGLARTYVGAFDGLQARLAHDAAGRPAGATLRFRGPAPAQARSFLRGFWLAGLAGATPWFPAGTLRTGARWPREALGERAHLDVLPASSERVVPRMEGGGCLVDVTTCEGEACLEVRFDGLVEVQEQRALEAVSAGMRDRGAATFRARDGRPVRWTHVQEVRIRHAQGGVVRRRDVTLEVEGALMPRDPGRR